MSQINNFFRKFFLNSCKGKDHPYRSFSKDVAGVAAVEFALIFPVMMTIWLGSVEVDNGLRISRRVQDAALILSDLSTQKSNIDAATLTSITKASEALMAPLNPDQMAYRLTSIVFSGSTAKVCWVYNKPNNWISRPTNNRGDILDASIVEIGARKNGQSMIMAEVEYSYMPITSWLWSGQRKSLGREYRTPRAPIAAVSLNGSGLPVGNNC